MSDLVDSSRVEPGRGKSPLLIILLTVFIDLVGFGIVIPVLPLYAEKFHASAFAIGALVGVYSLMTFIAAPLLGRLSDRVGRRPVLFWSILGTALGFAVLGSARALWLLFVGRIIDGITGGNISTAQAYIADITPPEKRSRAMGFIGAAFGCGFVFGPAIGGVLGSYSLHAPFYFAAGLACVNAALVYFLLPESLSHEHRALRHEKASLADCFRHSKGWALGAIMITYFFSIMGFAIMTTLFALYAKHVFALDAKHIGYIFAFVGTIGVIIQGGLLGRLVKVFGEKSLATTGCAILVAALYTLPLTRTLATLLMATAGIAIGNAFLTPTLNGLASRSVDASWQGRTLGLMQSSGSLGRFFGPLLAGWLLTFDGEAHYAQTAFWTASGILSIALVLMGTVWASDRPAAA